MKRRTFLQGAGAVAGLSVLGAPAIAQSKTKVKVGYLHTPAVDGQIWTGINNGSFGKQGLDLEMIQFTTGLELFQAMIGGSLDVLSTGAVVSNFPARGQGKVFLINNVEFATAQLWVNSDIKSFADLKGKKISTTTGTTAHVFLDNALRANKIDPSEVEIVNQRMAEAVTSFISGAVPAVALWVPFDVTVKEKAKGARKLVDASAYYPQAAIVGGWAARNDYFDKNRETLQKIIRGWQEANDHLIGPKSAEAVAALQKSQYPQVPLADFQEQFKASRYFGSVEWRKLYSDGTVTKWLQQVTDFFVKFGKIQNPVAANNYFDPKIFIETIKV
ncbi:MAG TPA: ABC transporter substrate-binding protein [Xanthobacteraceae bacterium]|nr:ABC transporter substrate-binding protein [Xanthobacteraceae bacterium]